MLNFARCLFAVVFILLDGTAAAQVSPLAATEPTGDLATTAENLSPDEINSMVSRLTDAEVRELLLLRLNADATDPEATAAQADFGEFFFHATIGAFGRLLGAFAGIFTLIERQGAAFSAFAETFGSSGISTFMASLAGAVAIGLVFEFAFNRVVSRWLRAPEMVENPKLSDSLNFLARRLAREVLGVVVFYVAASIAFHEFQTGALLQVGETFLFALIMVPRLAYVLSRFLLSPRYPEYRLVHTDDWTARFLTIHPVGLAVTGGLASTIAVINHVSGAPLAQAGLGFWLDLLFRLYLVWIIWRAWDGLVSMMRGTDPEVSRWEERVAQAYPSFAIGSVFAMWWLLATIVSYGAIEVLAGRGDIVTLVLLLLVPAFDTLIRAMVYHFVPPMTGEGPVAEQAYAATKAAYKRIGRVLLVGVGLAVIGRSWGISPEMLANAGAAGLVVGAFFDVSFVLALGYLSWEVSTLLINRRLSDEMTSKGLTPEAAGAGEVGGAGASRLSTVLPLFRLILQVAIVVVFGLVALSELGIDTTPLLAGAGIAGLAIGFGAQKLVSDVVSGAFFLIDDAFRMGEYVEMGETKGTVEKISVRSMQLRHHRGPVFTVPYGEIQFLKNYSRDWGIMKLPFMFPFDTDQERVRKIFKKIGQELLEHPEFGEYFIQPFKSQGVVSIDDVGMLIRGKFMAKPGKQFEIRKEVYKRVHAALEEAGIPFARREVRVAIPNLESAGNLTEEQKTQIAGAASAAAQQSADEQKAAQSQK